MLQCFVPPPGWRCTRERGHDGPCATISATGRDYSRAYAAVYAYIKDLDDTMPISIVGRNAVIWHAVQAALDAEREPQ